MAPQVAAFVFARQRCMHAVLPWVLLSLLGCAPRRPVETPPPASAATAPSPAASRPEVLRVRMLLVAHRDAKLPTAGVSRSRDEALERARMLAAMARSGEALASLVPTYSDRPSAAEDLGVTLIRPAAPEPSVPADVIARALELSAGALSEPIETPEGFVVLERLTDPDSAPQEIAARHILIAYAGSPQPVAGATRSQEEARKLAEEVWKQATAQDADFPALAARYTDEPGGKERGGDLRRFGRGQMVPVFERAAFSLAVGQVSTVIESPFGFHIILRYE